MADNVNVTPGAGVVIAADDIGGVSHQRVKVVLGIDGVSDGDVSSTNPMPVAGSVSVSNLPSTQNVAITSSVELEIKNDSGNPIPVSGTVTANTGLTQPLTDTQLRASAVPTSLATLPALTASSAVIGHVIVDSAPTTTITGTVTANAGSNLNTSALALESGGHLASIDTKTPALGQALSASSVPVVLPAAQITTLTPPTTVTVTQGTGTNLHTVVDSGTVTANIGTGNLAGITGTVTIKADTAVNQANALKVDGSAVTQPVSGSVSISGTPNVAVTSSVLPTGAATETTLASLNSKVTAVNTGAVVVSSSALPTGASTSALQTTGNTSLNSIDTKTPALGQALATASVPVVLPAAQLTTLTPLSTVTVTQATGTNLHTVVDSGSITANAGTNLNTSALNLETTQAAMSAKLPASLGAKTTANSMSVNIASDQTVPVSASQTGTWNITNVSGTVSLPTGAATSALQTTGNTSLSSIDTKTPAVGQALMAASTPVVIASNQSAVPVTGTFFQATQPVSIAASVAVTGPLTDTQLRATPVPITGSISATNPSVSTTGTAIPTSATMIGGSDGTNLRAAKVSATGLVSVDGSAVTQPISASSLPLPTGAATETTLAAMSAKLPALGQTTMSASQPVAIASDQSAIHITSDDITSSGSITTTQSVTLVLAGSEGAAVSVQGTWTGTIVFEISVDGGTTWSSADAFADATNGEVVVTQITAGSVGNWTFTNLSGVYAVRARGNTVSTGSATVVIRGNQIAFAYPTYIADNGAGLPTYGVMIEGTDGTNARYVETKLKGTQGTYNVSVQQPKDSGRTSISMYANNVAAGTTGTETAITLTRSLGTAATTTGASYVITSGKTFRITSITIGARGNATATTQISTFSLRMNTAGAVTTTSTPVLFSGVVATPATSSAWDRFSIPIPDGYEIVGNGTIQIGITANAVYTTNAPTWYVNIIGFEY